jgi:hypothetical protein
MWGTARSWLIWSKTLLPETIILSDREIQIQLDTGRLGGRVYGIIRTWANDEWPSIWSDMIQQYPIKCIQLKCKIQCNTILGRDEGSDMEGYCGARSESGQGSPCKPCYGSLFPQQTPIPRLQMDPMEMNESWMGWQLGERLKVLM